VIALEWRRIFNVEEPLEAHPMPTRWFLTVTASLFVAVTMRIVKRLFSA
jgi:hypothetical protein